MANEVWRPRTKLRGESRPPLQKNRFPDDLKEYVKRSFGECEPEARAEIEVELKKIITEAFNDNVVWSLEWNKMPLPQETLAKARIKANANR